MEKSQVKHGGKANGLRDLLHERGRRPRMRRIYVGKGGRITFFFFLLERGYRRQIFKHQILLIPRFLKATTAKCHGTRFLHGVPNISQSKKIYLNLLITPENIVIADLSLKLGTASAL